MHAIVILLFAKITYAYLPPLTTTTSWKANFDDILKNDIADTEPHSDSSKELLEILMATLRPKYDWLYLSIGKQSMLVNVETIILLSFRYSCIQRSFLDRKGALCYWF